MGVREGLLALLHVAPSHGYQLRADLETAVGGLWTVNVGQVYTTLQRLERDGLVEAAGAPDEDGRIPHSLTAAGHAAAVAWLAEPLARDDDVRDELVLKVLLARRTGLCDPLVVVDAQRTVTMRALQGFTRRRAALAPDALEQLLALDRLAMRARAELDWLDLVEERLDAAPPPAPVAPADTATVSDDLAPAP
jgi:DNA-binding PadR family transcriptional regulator